MTSTGRRHNAQVSDVYSRSSTFTFALGASAVQIGTAYLLCPEAQISPIYRQALKDAKDNETAITNVFTGRPARGIVNRLMREVGPMGPMSDAAPEFPLSAGALYRVNYLRHQRHRTDLCRNILREKHAPMPTGLITLGDNCVASFILKPSGLVYRGGRGYNLRACCPNAQEQILLLSKLPNRSQSAPGAMIAKSHVPSD
ncbi:NAD(P)H-dependent flavin oxidoreductase [Edaphobacter aggregans]|uniref:NAD(P)H-dependent flavin oxidoreductase n=1 Tax=Edaphobacter aggregans TaxID=570835 RepID=UPI000B0A5700